MAKTNKEIIAFEIRINGIDVQVRNLGDIKKAIQDITKERDKLSKDGGLDLTDADDIKRFNEINNSLSKLKATQSEINKGITEQAKLLVLAQRNAEGLTGSYNDLRNQTSLLSKVARDLSRDLPDEEWIKLRNSISAVIPEIKEMTVEDLRAGNALETLKTKIAANNVELRNFDREISGNNTLVGEYTRGIADFFKQFGGDKILTGKLDELKKKEQELTEQAKLMVAELLKTSKGTAEFEKLEASINDVQKELTQTTGQLKNVEGALGKTSIKGQLLQGVFTGMATALATFGLTSIIDGLRMFTKLQVDTDRNLAAVAKTTKLTKTEVRELNSELAKLDTGSAQTELQDIAIVAGKMGITGKQNILDFVAAADKINIALGRELGANIEDSIGEIAKIIEIFKLTDNYTLPDAIERVGSVINKLSDDSTASADQIVDFTKRLAGVAPQAGISATEILGLGTALVELGQSTEVGASAVQQLILSMGKDIPKFADIAGVSVTEFSKLLKEDANEAFLKMIENAKSSKAGLEGLAETFELVGADGVRAGAVLGALSENIDLVRKRQGEANKEFEVNLSLSNEVSAQNDTLGVSFSKLGKTLQQFATSSGFTDALKDMVTWTNNVIKAHSDYTDSFEKMNNKIIEVGGKSKASRLGRFDGGILGAIVGQENLSPVKNLIDVNKEIDKIIENLNQVKDNEGFQKLIDQLRDYRKQVEAGKVANIKSNVDIAASASFIENAVAAVVAQQTEWTNSIVKTAEERAKELKRLENETATERAIREQETKEREKEEAKRTATLKKENAAREAEIKRSAGETGSLGQFKAQISELETELSKTASKERQVKIILDLILLNEQLTEAEGALNELRASYERKPISVSPLPTKSDLDSSIALFLNTFADLKPTKLKLIDLDESLIRETIGKTAAEAAKIIEGEITNLQKTIKDNKDNPLFDAETAVSALNRLKEELSVVQLLSADLFKLPDDTLDLLETDIRQKLSELKARLALQDDEQLKLNIQANVDELTEKLKEISLEGLQRDVDKVTFALGASSQAVASLGTLFKEGSKQANIFAEASKKLAAAQNIAAQSSLILGIAKAASKGVFGIAEMFALLAAFASALASAKALVFGEGGDLESGDKHLLPARGKGMIRGNKTHASGNDIRARYRGRNIRLESGEALVDLVNADGSISKYAISKRTMADPVLGHLLSAANYTINTRRNGGIGGGTNTFANGGEITPNFGTAIQQTVVGQGVTPEQVQEMINAQLSKVVVVNNVVEAERVLSKHKINANIFAG